MTSERVAAETVRYVRRRANYHCEYCRLPQWSQEAAFHVDHIQSRTAGGQTIDDNLALACVTCSLRKGSRERVIDHQSGLWVRIYHPRRDRWNDHFAWTKTWKLRGKTPTGRGTIAALGMNRDAIVDIRRLLASLDKFPPS